MSSTTAATRPTAGRLGWAIFLIAAVGLVLSCVSVYDHYKKDPSAFCDINETFNCDIVNRSIYSEIGGIPVSIIGVAGYAALMVLSRMAGQKRLSLLMLLGTIGGLGFALYLTYIEARVLMVWCIVCLCSLATISVLTILSSWQTARAWRT
jgi:uncharacterized membrane protein